MAPTKRQKMAAACEKVKKEFGIPKYKVKDIVEDLLKVYGNNWEFIEDDNYKILVEAVLLRKQDEDKRAESNSKVAGSSSKSKREECNRKAAGSITKNKDVISLKEAQIHADADDPSISGVQKRRLRPRNPKGQAEVKSPKEAQMCADDDHPLISEPQKKRLRPRNQKGQVVGPLKNSKALLFKSSSRLQKDEVELSSGSQSSEEEDSEDLIHRRHKRDKKQVVVYEDSINYEDKFWPAETPLMEQESELSSCEDCEPLRKRLQFYDDKKDERNFVSNQGHGKIPLISQFSLGTPNFESSPDQILTENIVDFYHNDCLDFPSGEAYDYDQPLDEMPLNVMPSGDPYAIEPDVMEEQTSYLQFELSSVDDKGERVSRKSLFGIASTSNGEVKVSLSSNSSQSDFHIPNFDGVLKAVEEKYKLYRILDPDFSVKKLMGDVCECFLAMAIPSSVDRDLWMNYLALSKGSDGTNDSANCLCNRLSHSNCFNELQNVDKIVHQISCPVALTGLEGLHYVNGFKIPDIVDTSGLMKRIKVSEGMHFTNPCAVAGIKKKHISSAVKCNNYSDDITREEERVKISLVNSFCNEELPNFLYIRHNIVYDKARVSFALGSISDEACCSHCFGDCLALPLPCACSRISGGEFAYTREGLLTEKFLKECISLVQDPKEHHFFKCKRCPLEMSKNTQTVQPCKGHKMKMFIKECWSKCGCHKNCGNRVIQRGITVNLQVFWTPEGKGWGIRTLEDLPKGAFICEYVGEILTNTELHERIVQSRGKEKQAYTVLLDAAWYSKNVLKDEKALCLDATFYGNVSRFINHRCVDANLIGIPVEVETPDHHYYHLAFFTTREVATMEELTWDYGIDFNDLDHHIVSAFRCLCGSPLCRDPSRKK